VPRLRYTCLTGQCVQEGQSATGDQAPQLDLNALLSQATQVLQGLSLPQQQPQQQQSQQQPTPSQPPPQPSTAQQPTSPVVPSLPPLVSASAVPTRAAPQPSAARPTPSAAGAAPQGLVRRSPAVECSSLMSGLTRHSQFAAAWIELHVW
jgi:hypothetical protein